jgi:hypothetical protein
MKKTDYLNCAESTTMHQHAALRADSTRMRLKKMLAALRFMFPINQLSAVGLLWAFDSY